MASNYRAAWVPEGRDRSWDEDVDLALDWLEQEMADAGSRSAVLVTNTKDISGMAPRLIQFANRNVHTTPRSSYSVDVPRGVPVMAFVPSDKAFDLASSLARGSSLVVVESILTPLGGWAEAVGALDLTGTHQPAERTPDLAEALDRLDFCGNNGWGDDYGRRDALRILQELKAKGLLEKEALLGDMRARGHDTGRLKRLRQLIDKVANDEGRKTRNSREW